MAVQPYGGMSITGGADTLALSTTAAKLASWSASGGANSAADSRTRGGDPSVRPDKANNRILVNAPGVYEVHFDLSGAPDAAQDILVQVYRNGVAVDDLRAQARFTNAVKNNIALHGILEVTAAHNPKTIPTFADTTATTNPPAQVSYAAAPKTEVALEIYIKSLASTPTLTINDAHFTVKRLD